MTTTAKKLKIKLVRGRSKADTKQSKVLDSLGLRKTASVVFQDDTPNILGMINKVRHLVEVSENK